MVSYVQKSSSCSGSCIFLLLLVLALAVLENIFVVMERMESEIEIKCRENAMIYTIAYEYVSPIYNGLLALLMLVMFYKFLRAKCLQELKTTRLLFGFSCLFFIVCIAFVIMFAVTFSLYCRDPETYKILINGTTQLYVLGSFCFVGLLFCRLHFIFKESAFALSSCTVRVFVVIYMLDIVIGAVAAFFYSNTTNAFGSIFIFAVYAITLLLIFALDSLFVYKMYQVTHQQKGHKFMRVIIKTTFLTIVSSTFFVIAAVTVTLTQLLEDGNAWLPVSSAFAVTTDMVSNFLCVILSYQNFDAWYMALCGCCHRALYSCHSPGDKDTSDTGDDTSNI